LSLICLGYCTGLLIGWGHRTCRKSHICLCVYAWTPHKCYQYQI
jgi:hypothetical protein